MFSLGPHKNVSVLAEARSLIRLRSRASKTICSTYIGVLIGGLQFASSCGAHSAELSYWLREERGGKFVESCDGKVEGREIFVANHNENWVRLSGVVLCKDLGAKYSYEVKFLDVSIDPAQRSGIERDILDFDWLGLTFYRRKGNGETIDWLYDHSLPVRGSLGKTSDDHIFFGNLNFSVDKASVINAERMMFYLTASGPPFVFEVLP